MKDEITKQIQQELLSGNLFEELSTSVGDVSNIVPGTVKTRVEEKKVNRQDPTTATSASDGTTFDPTTATTASDGTTRDPTTQSPSVVNNTQDEPQPPKIKIVISEKDTKFLLGVGSEDDLWNGGFEELDQENVFNGETNRTSTSTNSTFNNDTRRSPSTGSSFDPTIDPLAG